MPPTPPAARSPGGRRLSVHAVLRVGLTGGIGSGKSTVARRLVGHGAVLIDSDVLAREVVEPGTDGLAEIVDAFGPAVLDDAGALDRPALAAVVFGNGAARERLNGIVHPRVRRRSDELIAAAPGRRRGRAGHPAARGGRDGVSLPAGRRRARGRPRSASTGWSGSAG